jgi:hypothetical protein
MVDRKVVPFDEFYYQLKLMHLFLLHPVCITISSHPVYFRTRVLIRSGMENRFDRNKK